MVERQRNGIRVATKVAEPAIPSPDDDLYAVAMLKVAMELKRGPARGFEAIFEETLKALDVDRDSFRAYLGRHMDKLMQTARKRGY
jgi:hypothetical protein